MIPLRTAAFLLIAVGSVSASEAWQKNLTPLVPGRFPPPRPHRATYGLGWEGFRAATAKFVFTRVPDKHVLRLKAQASTTGIVRTLWTLDANMISTVRDSSLRSVETRQHEKYRSEEKYFRLEFMLDRVIERRFESPSEKERTRKRTTKIANLLDITGAFLFLRSLPLKNGDTESIMVFPASKPYLARITVLGREKVKVPAGTFGAIKAKLELWKIERDFSLKPHTKFKSATAWISDDNARDLLKIDAGVFVGSVWAELENIEPL
jgi:hypothetical protein